MSKHAGRRQRWTQHDARAYSSNFGKVVYQQDGWYALLNYKTLGLPEKDGGMPT